MLRLLALLPLLTLGAQALAQANAPVDLSPPTQSLSSDGNTELLDRIIAIVNEGIVLQSDLDEETELVARQLQERGQNLPSTELLRKQVLERLIVEEAQIQRAEQIGINVDDAELNRTLNNISKNNGMSLEDFRAALLEEGYSYQKFRDDIRRELTVTRLRNRQVTSQISVSDQEIDEFLATQDRSSQSTQEYHLRQIFVAVPEGSSPDTIRAAQSKAGEIRAQALKNVDFAQLAVQVSEDQNALEGGDLGWRTAGQIPDQFTDALADLKVGDISEPIRSPIGFHLLKLEETRGEQRHLVRQTRARHILLNVNLMRTDEQARLTLEGLRTRILDGDDFAELAKAHSEDSVSAADGGNLGWYSSGSMAPQFEQVANSLGAKDISAPFKTPFGWHIVQVLERRKEDNTEEYRKSRAREVLHKRKVETETELWLRRLRDEAYVEYHQTS